jgi:serine/threonine protein kinase
MNQNFNQSKQNKITKRSDIYAIGAIIMKLLLGQPPTQQILKFISENKLQEITPGDNIFKIPPFFEDFIISNDMIYIIVNLLHQDPLMRFKDLAEVKKHFLELKNNID